MFTECHVVIKVDTYYDNCLYDACASGDVTAMVCSAMAAYGKDCNKAKLASKKDLIDWRKDVKECSKYILIFNKLYGITSESSI
jgi:hypothetical protein